MKWKINQSWAAKCFESSIQVKKKDKSKAKKEPWPLMIGSLKTHYEKKDLPSEEESLFEPSSLFRLVLIINFVPKTNL